MTRPNGKRTSIWLESEQLCLLLSLPRPAPFVFLNPATESRDKNGPAPRHPNDWAWSEQLAGLLIAELRAAPPPAAKKDLVARRAAEATIAGELTAALEDTRVRNHVPVRLKTKMQELAALLRPAVKNGN